MQQHGMGKVSFTCFVIHVASHRVSTLQAHILVFEACYSSGCSEDKLLEQKRNTPKGPIAEKRPSLQSRFYGFMESKDAVSLSIALGPLRQLQNPVKGMCPQGARHVSSAQPGW